MRKIPSTLLAAAGVTFALLTGGCVATGGNTAAGSAPMTREQGDAILAELREIRRALAEAPAARAKEPEAPRAPTVARVRADGGATLGNANAPITLVEYTDFQCPFCRRFHDRTFAQIRQNYVDTGKVRYVVRDLPLSFHEQAEPSAIGARCAADQGKYWPLRDALFAAQQELSAAMVRKTVVALGVDAARYDACVKNPATAAAVQADAEEAIGAGVDGTPGFIIGRQRGAQIEGLMMSGAQPYAAFTARLDAALNAAAVVAPKN